MAEELDERTSDEVGDGTGARQRDVEQGEEREGDANGDGEHQLAGDVATTKPWQPLEPQRVNYGDIRYDTTCYFNVRSKANIGQLNLPHGTNN